jgi:hypothetical protein
VEGKQPLRDTAALDRALRRAVRGIKDRLVRRWFESLLRSGETAGGDAGENTGDRPEGERGEKRPASP